MSMALRQSLRSTISSANRVRSHAGHHSETEVEFPGAAAVDHVNQRLFVVDNATRASIRGVGSQNMVFDIHPDRIETGSPMIAALGQPDFETTTPFRTRSGIDYDTRVGTGITPGRPRGTGLAYDPVHNRIFASDGGNHRILVFNADPSVLKNGPVAIAVIG